MSQRLARLSAQREADAVGFFGKLPSHGDFVSTALDRRLQAELDRWIQEGLRAMEAALGKDWRKLFEAAPAWRFVVASDIWAPTAIAGVFVPSRDRVGRSFPLIIAAQLRGFTGKLRDLCEDEQWFSAVETLARTSARPDFDRQRFADDVRRLRLPEGIARSAGNAAVEASESPSSLWWQMQPDTRLGKGFRTAKAPLASDFVKLVVREDIAAPTVSPVTGTLRPDAVERKISKADLSIESSCATHPGTRLSLNADVLLTSENSKLFALADGVGDGTAAIEAARLTTAALANIVPPDSLETFVRDIKGKLGQANGLLQANRLSGDKDPSVASIVVAALHDEALALVWAGDARCYLLRNGMMRCLSRDHIEVGLRRTLARGVGLKQQFIPETLVEPVRRGDRIVLCSASVSRILPDRAIAEILLQAPIAEASDTLIQEGLIANCRENLSAIVVELT